VRIVAFGGNLGFGFGSFECTSRRRILGWMS
jgi:hypothetical protein